MQFVKQVNRPPKFITIRNNHKKSLKRIKGNLQRDQRRSADVQVIKDVFRWGGSKLRLVSVVVARHLVRVRARVQFSYKPPKKLDWKWVLIAFLVGMLITHPRAVSIPETQYPTKPPTQLPALKPSKHKKAQEVHIATPAPKVAQSVPKAVSGGCVTGYSTGSYALDQLISHESGGRSCAENAGGCFGLLQACPGYPLKVACGGNPSCQIKWFTANKLGGYGSWERAWATWQSRCGGPQGCWW